MNRSAHVDRLMRALQKPWPRQMYPAAPRPEKRVRVGLVLALALLILIGVVEYQVTLQIRQTKRWESRIGAALDKLEAIASQLKDAETGQRGYVITGDERYLEPYRAATQTLDRELESLRVLTADDPGLRSKIDRLAPLIVAKLAAMSQLYDTRRSQGFDSAAQVSLINRGQAIMDDILRLITELEEEQDLLLQQKIDEVDARGQTINLSTTFGSFVAILLAIFMISRDIVERKRADAALRESAARFHRLAENALDMIYRYRLTPTPSFEYVSPAATAISGYTPEDFYNDPDLGYKLVHPEDDGFIEALKHPSGSTVPLTIRWVHKDGTVIWTSQQLVPIYDRAGGLVAIEGIVRDVTERMQAYQMLERRVEERTHEIERRRRVAEGLRDILTVLNSNRPLDEILDAIVAQACRLLETDAGAVYRRDDQQQLLSLQAARGLAADDAAISIPVGWGVLGQVVLTRQPVVVSNVADTLRDRADTIEGPEFRARLAHLYRRYSAVLAVPLMIKDEVYGAITLYYEQPREFSEEEIEMAVAFSDQAALAIENARLRVQAQQIAVAAERSRLARDLHDAVTQTLFSTSLIADVLPRLWERNVDEARLRLDELRQLTRGALAEMRTLLLELRPSSLIEVGLHELLRQLAEATIGRARVPVTLTVEGQCRLPPDVQIAFYRIAQEALNNIVRHAGASQAAVSLHCRLDLIELYIRDDGQGFDPTRVAGEHLGLSIMRERAETIGATLLVDSYPGGGAQIVVVWQPLRAVAAGQIDGEHAPQLVAAVASGVGYE